MWWSDRVLPQPRLDLVDTVQPHRRLQHEPVGLLGVRQGASCPVQDAQRREEGRALVALGEGMHRGYALHSLRGVCEGVVDEVAGVHQSLYRPFGVHCVLKTLLVLVSREPDYGAVTGQDALDASVRALACPVSVGHRLIPSQVGVADVLSEYDRVRIGVLVVGGGLPVAVDHVHLGVQVHIRDDYLRKGGLGQ